MKPGARGVRPFLICFLMAGLLMLSGTTRIIVTNQGWSGVRVAPPSASASFTAEIPHVLPDNSYLAGRKLLALGDGGEANNFFEHALLQHPELAPYISYSLADARVSKGDTAGAIETLAKISSLRDRAIGAKALARQADLLSACRRYSEAATAFDELASRRSGDDRRNSLINSARMIVAVGDTSVAQARLFDVLKMPGSPQVGASAAAEILRISTEQADQALTLRFAGLFYSAGEFSKAVEQYQKVSSPSPAIMFQHARSHEHADQFRQAIAVYKRLLDRATGISPLLVKFRIGLCLQRIGEDVEGEKYFQQILSAAPRSSLSDDILYRMATRRDQRGKRDAALDFYRRLLKEYPRSPWADESAWKIGLADLEDGKPEAASFAFEAALRRYPRSDYAPAMGYWRGKILETAGSLEEAKTQYASVLRNATDPYYRGRASAAFRKLGGRFTQSEFDAAITHAQSGDILVALGELRAIRDVDTGILAEKARTAASDIMSRIGLWRDIARFSTEVLDTHALFFDLAELAEENPRERRGHPQAADHRDPDHPAAAVAEINGLIAIGDYEDASAEILALKIDAGARPERQLAMIRLLAEGGAYRRVLREIESLVRVLGGPSDPAAMPPVAAQLLYPRFYAPIVNKEAARYGIDYRLLLAVIREESRFQADVSSWAGAQGLMQIMPATGEGAARDLSILGYRREMLLDPHVNIAIGAYCLNGLLNSYGGKRYLALAGYNAGSGNANRWLRQNPGVEEEFLVEQIPFRETRNYVKRVLGTYWTYKQLDGEPLG